MQNATVRTQLGTLSATDPDYQFNALVAYTFENNSVISGPFELDRETGQLWTRDILDREQRALYSVSVHNYRYVCTHLCQQKRAIFVFSLQLTVVATDQFGAGRATPTTITVTVLDINDNDPYLLRSVRCTVEISRHR